MPSKTTNAAYIAARAQNEQAKAKLNRLKLDEAKGHLISADIVADTDKQIAKAIATSLKQATKSQSLNWPEVSKATLRTRMDALTKEIANHIIRSLGQLKKKDNLLQLIESELLRRT